VVPLHHRQALVPGLIHDGGGVSAFFFASVTTPARSECPENSAAEGPTFAAACFTTAPLNDRISSADPTPPAQPQCNPSAIDVFPNFEGDSGSWEGELSSFDRLALASRVLASANGASVCVTVVFQRRIRKALKLALQELNQLLGRGQQSCFGNPFAAFGPLKLTTDQRDGVVLGAAHKPE
jgi:hypothetical protein